MAQRAGWFLIALLGVLLIAGLALLGRDTYRLARAGPKWRRRLVAAGLALLSVLGLPACGETKDTTPATVRHDGQPAATLAEARGWARVMDAWRGADETLRRLRGPYPIRRATRDQLLTALDVAVKDIHALEQHALLGSGQAGLLLMDISELKGRVARMEVAGESVLSCYEAMTSDDVIRFSAEHLSRRLPLLKRLAVEEKVQPQVLRKVMASIEGDLRALATAQADKEVSAEQKAKAQEMHNAVSAELARIKAAMERQ
jgi:hypothetical protein